MKMNLPNKLTLLRLIMVPFFMVAMALPELLELAPTVHVACNITGVSLFILASVTDFLDGMIARKNGLVTNFGKFMDPLADKLLVIAAMSMFCEWGTFPAWALMIVLTREFAVSGLRMVAGPKGKVTAAGKSGKIKTFSTMVGLCVMVAVPQVSWIGITVMVVIVTTTLYSGVEYFIQNWNCLWD